MLRQLPSLALGTPRNDDLASCVSTNDEVAEGAAVSRSRPCARDWDVELSAYLSYEDNVYLTVTRHTGKMSVVGVQVDGMLAAFSLENTPLACEVIHEAATFHSLHLNPDLLP